MLTLNKQSDYALIIVSQLLGKEDFIPLSELVDNTNLPKRFLARIAATLVNRKLLISREGRVGGYKLSPNIQTITMYDFLHIFEKQLNFLDCMSHSYKCKYEKVCKHRHGIRSKLNEIVLEQLKKTRLMDLF
jgi:Rrf2 family protein